MGTLNKFDERRLLIGKQIGAGQITNVVGDVVEISPVTYIDNHILLDINMYKEMFKSFDISTVVFHGATTINIEGKKSENFEGLKFCGHNVYFTPIEDHTTVNINNLDLNCTSFGYFLRNNGNVIFNNCKLTVNRFEISSYSFPRFVGGDVKIERYYIKGKIFEPKSLSKGIANAFDLGDINVHYLMMNEDYIIKRYTTKPLDKDFKWKRIEKNIYYCEERGIF